jgi:hypothetical protein
VALASVDVLPVGLSDAGITEYKQRLEGQDITATLDSVLAHLNGVVLDQP